MRKNLLLVTAVAGLALIAGGCRPYNQPKFEEIDPNESAFMIPLDGNTEAQQSFESEEFLRKNQLAAKRVQVPRRWVQKGYTWFHGEYIDTVRVIKVDRSPVTRNWDSNKDIKKDQAIWVESADSVVLSMDITCTTMVDPNDVPTFLFRYPSGSLAVVMDNEVRARIQQELAEEVAIFKLDEIKPKKAEIISRVRERVVPYFKERGITIATLGLGGGFDYENKEIQIAIDQTIKDQQLQVSAKAKWDAQLKENERIKAEAEALAEAARLKANGEAEAIKLLADAKAYEIDKAKTSGAQYIQLRQLEILMETMKKWDGKLPVYNMNAGGANNTPSLLLSLPNVTENK
jgi:regulator of protease activity HflC (stomatin/prohibitin superfamily)